jgi:hypothetical protein
MRRMIGIAVLIAAVGSTVLGGPALAADGRTTPLGGALSPAPCKLANGSNYGHADYTVVNGHATSGRWDLHALATCARPELAVTVKTNVLQNGRAVGPTFGGACVSNVSHPTCSRAAAAGAFSDSHMSGVWTIEWTMTVRGADAVPMILLDAGVCGYNAKAAVVTCTWASKPIRIP